MGNNLKFNNYTTFFILLATYYVLLLYINQYIFTENLFYNSYSAFLNERRISELLEHQKKMRYLQYIFFLVYLFIKIVFSSFCFFTYGYFIDAKLTWRNAVQIALVGEIVFVIQMFMKVIYFTFVVPEKLDDISGYTAMSLKYFFSSGVPQFFNYLFLTVNVYELIYILLVARLISKETSNNYINGVIFVLKSYGIGMILWMLVITFLLIQIV